MAANLAVAYAQGFVTMFLCSRAINDVIVVPARWRELPVLRGRISDTMLDNLMGITEFSVLHNSPVSRILKRTPTSAHGGGTCNSDVCQLSHAPFGCRVKA